MLYMEMKYICLIDLESAVVFLLQCINYITELLAMGDIAPSRHLVALQMSELRLRNHLCGALDRTHNFRNYFVYVKHANPKQRRLNVFGIYVCFCATMYRQWNLFWMLQSRSKPISCNCDTICVLMVYDMIARNLGARSIQIQSTYSIKNL